MKLNKTKEGRHICPNCGQHDTSVIIDSSTYVFPSFLAKLKYKITEFVFSDNEYSVGYYITRMYICDECGFKVTDRKFIAWNRGDDL